ncbi:hypothetical protein [Pseudarthrobacter albicanus]|uniref:hypothetical protein n=1 Tax=Pseudarthrobacter albicanus TaxID=2823873 RepID=UPI001BA52993|nr:hypothetical protein [Pseudarthrobacter albicanus]
MTSNEDPNLNDVMPADEQEAIWKAGILGHFRAQWAELQAVIAQLKEHPELVTREHVMFVKEATRGLMEWLRANGINAWFDVTEATGLDEVKAGDRL